MLNWGGGAETGLKKHTIIIHGTPEGEAIKV